MKPRLYKRYGRWNLQEGDKVTTIWWSLVGEMTLANAIEYLQFKAKA